MDSVDEVLSRFTDIQNKLYSDKRLDDLFDITYVYSQLERFCNDVDTTVLVQGINILHDSIILTKGTKNEVFDSQISVIIRSVVRCLDIPKDEVSTMAESLLLDICSDQNFSILIKKEVEKSRSCGSHTLSSLEVLDRILLKATAPQASLICTTGENIDDRLGTMNVSSAYGNGVKNSTCCDTNSVLLEISFLPQSTTEQWLLARGPEEVSNVLDEVYQLYLSLNEDRRTRCVGEVSKLVNHAIRSMKLNDVAVVVNGLQLLEALVSDHANEFIPELSALFPRIQQYMDDSRVTVRHHALRLGGALVVRIPFSSTGRYVFGCIDCKPSHPEISLRCASLALLCVQPSRSVINPLISRIVLIAGEYLGVTTMSIPDSQTPVQSTAAQEAAKDLVAIALMILCFSGNEDVCDCDAGIEDVLPRKLCSLVGIPPTFSCSRQICQRALQSNFPSLESESYTSTLAALAMESSLSDDMCPSARRGKMTTGKSLSEECEGSGYDSGRPVVSYPTTTSLPQTVPASDNNSQSKNTTPGIRIEIPSSPALRSHHPSTSENNSLECSMTLNNYQPSWTPCDSGVTGYASLASPWACTSKRMEADGDNDLDKSKLRSIKRGGRKPGSRLRARTADQTSQSDEWTAGSLQNAPATAFGRIGGSSEGDMPLHELKTPVDTPSPDPIIGSNTPIELGRYSNDGKREHRLEGKSRAPLPPRPMVPTANHRSKLVLESNGSGVETHLSLRVGNYDCDSDTKLSAEEDDRDPHRSETEFGMPKRPHLSKPKNIALSTGSDEDSGNGFAICGSSVFGSNDAADGDGFSFVASRPPRRNRHNPQRKEPCKTSLSDPHTDEDKIARVARSSDDDNGVASSQETFEYLSTDQLLPCVKPKRDINKVVSGLANHDWPDIFHTLNIVRQLAIHHGNDLHSSGHLHTIVLGVMKQVENLRSAAAKNAILALGDIYRGLKVGVDAEVAASGAVLIKRVADSSVFISESIDDSLTAMIDNVSPSRTLTALLSGIDNRSGSIRGQVVRMIVILFQNRTMELNNTKDLEALFSKMPKMLADTSPESRTFGRELVRLLLTSRLTTKKYMEELLSEEIVKKSLRQSGDYITNRFSSLTRSPGGNRSGSPVSRYNLSNKTKKNSRRQLNGTGDLSINVRDGSDYDSPTEDLVVSGRSPRAGSNCAGGIASMSRKRGGCNVESQGRTLTKLQQENYPEIVALPGIINGLSSKNWSERRDSLTTLCDSMLLNYELFAKAGKLQECMESMLERFDDGSVKVVLHAVSCVSRAHAQYPNILSTMLLTSLPAVLNVESSANKQVAKEGALLLASLLAVAPNTALSQQLVGIALHDKDRARAAAFRAMTKYIYIHIAREKRNEAPAGTIATIMKRNFYPVVCQTLCSNSSKSEVKTFAADTLRAIQKNSNEYIGDW
eukprot:CAMPEP_0185022652 /NCGR_PEP_ID=MMETSP1103-20130426/5358_1 /TAXON_ID=36769 /ORGANISM="Paraphysomonas bandaiensis, Strain Caron Lab Isolate" /LENGTH=1419 /DNA_ID=CAMNT_0027554823 /DNA_START=78 /DNA_END=4334 /DNA_ORIENTATION=+